MDFYKRSIKQTGRIVEDSISRYWVVLKVLRGTIRFPWASGKLPQASPSGILPIMFIP
ncbi:hypothetical protein HBHAL_4502 [Halobacillus halophilus DSM 2266]|uniref:Uncharacterized protein n=1 Tax=Halobacillus halophilus (strain ATCC 35676 / DSM 2266 / JCM 20832 / KCTC 3685 / LMG 17431 / NBRC 102448 / NCIMB 2269) TaxID=866895 RepID=I0JRS1_HALH3|nr:hypothetical protein [Halobacillus halophilus]CCG46842.1 hypothetical protein HBHAL_4502 [Halobacillus halophilus DSM 2266]